MRELDKIREEIRTVMPKGVKLCDRMWRQWKRAASVDRYARSVEIQTEKKLWVCCVLFKKGDRVNRRTVAAYVMQHGLEIAPEDLGYLSLKSLGSLPQMCEGRDLFEIFESWTSGFRPTDTTLSRYCRALGYGNFSRRETYGRSQIASLLIHYARIQAREASANAA